jgi:hypothetical protein
MDTLTDVVAKGNSAFDPLGSAGTAQAAGFDQWALMYSRYRVHQSRITAWCGLATAGVVASVGALRFAVVPSNASTAFTTFDEAVGSAYAKSDEKAGNFQVARISHSMSTRKVTGMGSLAGPDQLQALVTADPAELWYWHIVAQLNTTTTNQGGVIDFVIEQDVEFFDRKSPADAFELMKRLETMLALRKKRAELKVDVEKDKFELVDSRESKTPADAVRVTPAKPAKAR